MKYINDDMAWVNNMIAKVNKEISELEKEGKDTSAKCSYLIGLEDELDYYNQLQVTATHAMNHGVSESELEEILKNIEDRYGIEGNEEVINVFEQKIREII